LGRLLPKRRGDLTLTVSESKLSVTMNIVCNGKDMEVKDGVTIESLILDLDLNPATVVVECNGSIVLPDDYAGQQLSEGAVLELIRFVGGG